MDYFLLSVKCRCCLTHYQLEKRCQNVQDILNHTELQSDEKISITQNGRWSDDMPCLFLIKSKVKLAYHERNIRSITKQLTFCFKLWAPNYCVVFMTTCIKMQLFPTNVFCVIKWIIIHIPLLLAGLYWSNGSFDFIFLQTPHYQGCRVPT